MIDILIGCHHYSMIYIMIVPVSGLYWKSWGCSSSHSSSPPTSWSPFTKQIFKINMILLHCSSQIVLLIVLYAPILIQAKQSIFAETVYLGNGHVVSIWQISKCKIQIQRCPSLLRVNQTKKSSIPTSS